MIQPTRAMPPGDPVRKFWADRTLGSYLDTVTPSRTAIVDGDVRVDYAQLTSLVDACETGLRALGLQRGDVVTVDLPNWWEANVAMLGVLRCAAVVDPVIPIYRDAEVGFILRQAMPSVVMIPHRFRGFDFVEMMLRLTPSLIRPVQTVVVRPEAPLPDGFLSFDDLLARRDGPSTDESSADDVALLLYTSGTTADPKGVLHSHNTLEYENRSIIDLLRLTADDRLFMPSPVTHITGFLYGVLLPVMLDTSVTLLDVWDPARGKELIDKEDCRVVIAATPFLQGLTDEYAHGGTGSPLRIFACGGADVPPQLVERAQEVLAARVMRVYGSSEFPTLSCGAPDDDIHIRAETDGRPIGEVQIRLAEAVDGVGELLVRGPDLFLGYLDPKLNADAFDDDGYFRTGDLASLDGDAEAVVIRGRKKDIIIRGGENISAKEVEDRLYEHRSVCEVAVVAMPDPKMGEKACAFVVPTNGCLPTLQELASHLGQCGLAKQKFPERLELVDALPKTQSGKVQKFVLRELVAEVIRAEREAGR